jgi:hypothetical protein
VSPDGQFSREVWNVDNDDVTGLRRDDTTRIGLGETEHNVVAVGVVGKHFSGAGKTAEPRREDEPVTRLVEDGQVVVEVVDVDDDLGDDVRRFRFDDFELVLSTSLKVLQSTA